MGSKREKDINQESKQQMQQAQQGYGDFAGRAQAEQPWAQTAARDALAGSWKGYQDLAQNPMSPYGQGVYDLGQSFAGGAALDPRAKAGMFGDAESMRNVYQNPELLKGIRSNFGEFAQTGGFAPGERERMIRRASDAPASMFQSFRNEMDRRNSAGFGGMPFTGSQDRMARSDAARAIGRSAYDAEADTAERIRQGRMWGGQNQSGAEQAIGQGRLQGFQGAGDLLARMTAMDMQGRLGGLGAMQGAAGMADARQMAGAGGMGSLAGQLFGYESDLANRQLQGLSGQAGAGQSYIGNRLSAREPGWGDKLLSAGVGLGSAFLGGGLGGGPTGGMGPSNPITLPGQMSHPGGFNMQMPTGPNLSGWGGQFGGTFNPNTYTPFGG